MITVPELDTIGLLDFDLPCGCGCHHTPPPATHHLVVTPSCTCLNDELVCARCARAWEQAVADQALFRCGRHGRLQDRLADILTITPLPGHDG